MKGKLRKVLLLLVLAIFSLCCYAQKATAFKSQGEMLIHGQEILQLLGDSTVGSGITAYGYYYFFKDNWKFVSQVSSELFNAKETQNELEDQFDRLKTAGYNIGIKWEYFTFGKFVLSKGSNTKNGVTLNRDRFAVEDSHRCCIDVIYAIYKNQYYLLGFSQLQCYRQDMW